MCFITCNHTWIILHFFFPFTCKNYYLIINKFLPLPPEPPNPTFIPLKPLTLGPQPGKPAEKNYFRQYNQTVVLFIPNSSISEVKV